MNKTFLVKIQKPHGKRANPYMHIATAVVVAADWQTAEALVKADRPDALSIALVEVQPGAVQTIVG